jgi:hypothetical protein
MKVLLTIIYNKSIGKFISISGNGFPSVGGNGALSFESSDCSGQAYVLSTNQANYSVHVIRETYTSQTFSYYVAKNPQLLSERKTILSWSKALYPNNRECTNNNLPFPEAYVIAVENINLTFFDNIPFFPLVFK